MTAPATIDRASSDDVDAIIGLLASHHLPIDGVVDRLATTLVAREGGRVAGSAALEVYPDGALMRSVAVSPLLQNSGLGRRLTERVLTMAADLHVPAVYLLTTTAEGYFPRFSFVRIPRDQVPAGVARSTEFTSACPSSAAVMRKAF